MKFLYTLNHNKLFVGMNYDNHSYILSFPHLKNILYTKSLIHPEKHSMFITKYSATNISLKEQLATKNINGYDIDIYSSKGIYLHLSKNKKESMESSVYILTTPLEDIIMYPIFHNIGLIMAIDIMDETNEELVFSTQIIKPIQEPALFKLTLP